MKNDIKAVTISACLILSIAGFIILLLPKTTILEGTVVNISPIFTSNGDGGIQIKVDNTDQVTWVSIIGCFDRTVKGHRLLPTRILFRIGHFIRDLLGRRVQVEVVEIDEAYYAVQIQEN